MIEFVSYICKVSFIDKVQIILRCIQGTVIIVPELKFLMSFYMLEDTFFLSEEKHLFRIKGSAVFHVGCL